MKKVRFLNRFVKDYAKLPLNIQETADKQIERLLNNPKHPSLNRKKMRDPRDIWEIRITRSYRATFQIQDDLYIMRRVGPHDILRNP